MSSSLCRVPSRGPNLNAPSVPTGTQTDGIKYPSVSCRPSTEVRVNVSPSLWPTPCRSTPALALKLSEHILHVSENHRLHRLSESPTRVPRVIPLKSKKHHRGHVASSRSHGKHVADLGFRPRHRDSLSQRSQGRFWPPFLFVVLEVMVLSQGIKRTCLPTQGQKVECWSPW